jgi:hypothetical protein
VEEVTTIAKKSESLTKQEIEERLKEEREENRERKEREMNIIIHGLEKCNDQGLSGPERMEQDARYSQELFAEAGVRVTPTDIKFCRRVGPRGEKERPLIVGFYSAATRNRILRADFTSSQYEVSIGPDLTKKQREEEAEIWKEKERRNLNRTAEEKSKNLVWRLVGPKGERRLVLSTTRTVGGGGGAAWRGAGRGRGAVRGGAVGGGAVGGGAVRGSVVVRGRGRVEQRGAARGGVSRLTEVNQTTRLGPELLDPMQRETEFRPRIGSKRKEPEAANPKESVEDVEEGMREPPTKHQHFYNLTPSL